MKIREVPFAADELMARVEGDRGLLSELVELFRRESPRQLLNIRRSLEASDSRALREAAHAMKGSLGNFAAKGAAQAALALEVMGRDGVLDGADVRLADLEQQVISQERSLVRFLEDAPN
jgi:HPt (histidine-containing phosphotransfer) domain-containing protein